MLSDTFGPSLRRAALLGVTALAAVALAGCVPEPGGPAPSGSASSSPAPTSTESASPTPTEAAGALPADCAAAYSSAMLSSLEAENPPLNDPGITLLSTDQAPLLELLESVPTLRCTWGVPSESGLATNVSAVDGAQAADVLAALTEAGFGCEEDGDATLCRIEQRGVDLDSREYVRGETHGIAGGFWVATNWVNFAPDGYTEDILATLRG